MANPEQQGLEITRFVFLSSISSPDILSCVIFTKPFASVKILS